MPVIYTETIYSRCKECKIKGGLVRICVSGAHPTGGTLENNLSDHIYIFSAHPLNLRPHSKRFKTRTSNKAIEPAMHAVMNFIFSIVVSSVRNGLLLFTNGWKTACIDNHASHGNAVHEVIAAIK